MSERMVGKITIGGVELQTPILDVPRDSAERDAMERHYSLGFRAGAEATQAAACAMLERAQQPAAALGVSLMKLPKPPK